jgi:hypothetical protein
VPLRTRLCCDRPGLTGPDLVRLVLERCASSAAAVQLLTDLIGRHGQGAFPGCPDWAGCDHAFLLADARECFAVEAAGAWWVTQEVREIRALGGLCTVRQDWDYIAPGLSAKAIDAGWWPGDGSKLDFAGAVGAGDADAALRRWGRCLLLLGQENGYIDAGFVRRLLADHYEGCSDEADPRRPDVGPAPLCRHGSAGVATAASLVVALGGRPALPVAWCAFGPPCLSVYFPVFLDGELPPALTAQGARLRAHLEQHPEQWGAARESLGQLQARFDQEAAEFAAEALPVKQAGAGEELARRIGLFAQHCVEQHEAVLSGLQVGSQERYCPTPAGLPGR